MAIIKQNYTGSSKHGKAFLASVGENCVVAKYLNLY